MDPSRPQSKHRFVSWSASTIVAAFGRDADEATDIATSTFLDPRFFGATRTIVCALTVATPGGRFGELTQLYVTIGPQWSAVIND